MTADDWTAVGSIATALAALAAVITLVVAWKQRRDHDAAALRKSIRVYVAAIRRLRGYMDGIALIGAAGATIRAVESQLPPRPSMDDVWVLLDSPAHTLLAATEGVAAGAFGRDAERAHDDLVLAGLRLVGDLEILAAPGRVLRRMWKDSNDPLLLSRVLSPEMIDLFRKNDTSKNAHELVSNLRSHLQGNAAGYVVARYEEALTDLDEFVNQAASLLTHLNNRRLLHASRVKIAVEPATDTGAMRASIVPLVQHRLIGRDDGRHLTDLADRIEAQLDGPLDQARALAGATES